MGDTSAKVPHRRREAWPVWGTERRPDWMEGRQGEREEIGVGEAELAGSCRS